jgi:hypothetical protein
MFNFFKRKYPKYIKDVWYNASLYITDKDKYPKVFDKDNKYIGCKIGLIVKMFETEDNKSVFYKVINTRIEYGSDWLYPSDAIQCDLKFSHIEKD